MELTCGDRPIIGKKLVVGKKVAYTIARNFSKMGTSAGAHL
jgi:hypothetical protein